MTTIFRTRTTAGALALVLATAVPALAQRTLRPGHVTDEVIRHVTRDVHQVLTALEGLRHDVHVDVTGPVQGALAELGRLGDLPALAGLAAADQERFPVEQVDRQTRTVELGASGELELRNIAGDITVTAGGGTAATIEIVRTSRGRTEADASQGLEEVQVEVTENRGRAEVAARYPQNRRRSAYSVTVGYQVTAPAGTRLTVGSTSGSVTVRGMQGDLAVDIVSGDIQITDARRVTKANTIAGSVLLRDVDSDAPLELTSVAGTVRLERVRTDRLEVTAVSGAILATEVTAGSAELNTMAGRISYDGPLSAGGRYEFQAHSGAIELIVSGGAGFEFEASTFTGNIETAEGLELTNVSRSRRSLRGRVGDGAASVVATTFSGGVTIRRR